MSEGVSETQAGGTASETLRRMIACWLILWTSFVLIVAYRGFPIPFMSLLASAFFFLPPAIVCALVAGRSSGIRHAIVFGLLLCLFLDLQWSGFDGVFAWAGLVLAPVVCWVMRRELVSIVTVVFATMLVSSAFSGGDYVEQAFEERAVASNAPATAADAPRRVHIILDGFAGLDGLPTDIPGGAALRADLEAFFTENGFRLHRDAISEYLASRSSISSTLNFEANARPDARVRGKRPYVVLENLYFEALAARFASLHVVQSTYLDVCAESPVPISSCWTIRYDGTDWLREAELGVFDKTRVLIGMYVNLPGFFEAVGKAYHRNRRKLPIPLPAFVQWDGGVAPMSALAAFDRLESSVIESQAGSAHFAHLLLPHGPYVLNERCEIVGNPFGWLSHTPIYAKNNRPEDREVRYRAYFGQVRCAMHRLDRFFESLRAAGLWANTTIVLHGDHGSRIFETFPRADNADDFTAQDLEDGFRTLFAVRHPGSGEGGVAPREARSLSELLAAEFLETAEDAPPSKARPPTVYLEGEKDEDWRALRWTIDR